MGSLDAVLGEIRKKEFSVLGTALIGFDGYIDRVVRIKKDQNVPAALFESTGDFAEYILKRRGKSVDLALLRQSEKIGGNGPIMAESLALKNIQTVCIGAMGYPKLNPVYHRLNNMCRLLSVEETAFTLALEFNDAKLMLAEKESLDRVNWERLCTIIGEEELASLVIGTDLLAFTNWSGIAQSNDILSGIAALKRNNKGILFLDLADPSCKSPEQFAELFSLIEKLSSSYNIIMGFNNNELLIMYNHFFGAHKTVFDRNMVSELVDALPLDEIVIHGIDWAEAHSRDKHCVEVVGEKVANPVILTGAGDNFNAGYCWGKLCSLDSEACLYLGNISATMYVERGHPVGIQDIVSFIENRRK